MITQLLSPAPSRGRPLSRSARTGTPRQAPQRPGPIRHVSPRLRSRFVDQGSAQPRPGPWGDFLTAATKQLSAALPTPGKRGRKQPLNFSPRRGRSASTAKSKAAAPPTAEWRAQVQVLRTLGIIGTNQVISAAVMKAYDDLFAPPIPFAVLSAIAALVDRELPANLNLTTIAEAPTGSPIVV